MNKTVISGFLIGLVSLAASGIAPAQDEGNTPLIIPVELFACSYNEGKGPADLDPAVDKWNKWADKVGIDAYSAWTLTPYYFSPKQEFDLIWVGAAKNAIELGKSQDAYVAETDGLHAAFADVMSCGAHLSFASIQVKAPAEGATPGDSVMSFSDCKIAEGVTFPQLSEANDKWAQYLADQGYEGPVFHWYPAYGGGKEEYSFKRIHAYKNLADLGAGFERYGNGGGYMVFGELMNGLVECDANRAYIAKNRRYVQIR